MTDLPALLSLHAERRGAAPAMRQKRLGIWRSWTWRAMADEVSHLAGGLAARGVGVGERVLVAGSARPQLLVAMLALQSLGAVPVLPTDEAEASPGLLRGLRFAFAGGQRLAGTLLEAAAASGTNLTVFAVDTHGIGHLRRGRLEAYEALLADAPGTPVAADAVPTAAILYPCDGAGARTLDHAALLEPARRAEQTLGATAADRMVSFLPLGSLPALLLGPVLSLLAGFPLFFPESDATILADLREAGPTLLAAPPLLLRQIRRAVFLRTVGSRSAWRGILQRTLNLQGDGDMPRGLARWLGDALIRGPVRDQAGLGRVRRVVGFGGPIPPALAGFYDVLGIRQVAGEAMLFPGATAAADPLETALRGSLFVRDACVTGDGQAVMAWLDDEAVAAWAQSAGIAIAGLDELPERTEVQALVAGEIARAAAARPTEAPPTRFAIAATRLSRAAGEIGQDGSLRREAVLRHRAAAFASLRDGGGQPLVASRGEARVATTQRAPAAHSDIRAGVAA